MEVLVGIFIEIGKELIENVGYQTLYGIVLLLVTYYEKLVKKRSRRIYIYDFWREWFKKNFFMSRLILYTASVIKCFRCKLYKMSYV